MDKKKLKVTVNACIVDHWHPDAMEGIDVLSKDGITSYSYYKTKQIAFAKKLYAPTEVFYDSLVLPIGNKTIVARYFGPGHSVDDIVVWLPDENILFGSCGVKSHDAWVGNIADANLADWSTTITKVKTTYPNAKTIIPGHGQYGGTELLDYTIKMFEIFSGFKHQGGGRHIVWSDFPNGWAYIIRKEGDTVIDNKYYLINAYIAIDKDSETVHISSPLIEYDSINKVIKVETGDIDISKRFNFNRIWFSFKSLTLIRKEEEPKMSIIIQEFAF